MCMPLGKAIFIALNLSLQLGCVSEQGSGEHGWWE